MKTEIQETELYKSFKSALGISDMRSDDNRFVVECCKIAQQYADKAVTELNERNSVDEGEKSLPHTCACGNEKKSWYKTCDKCWHKEKSQ